MPVSFSLSAVGEVEHNGAVHRAGNRTRFL